MADNTPLLNAPNRAKAEEPLDRSVLRQLNEWKTEAKDLAKMATVLAPLAKPNSYRDLTKVPALIDTIEGKLRALSTRDRGMQITAQIRNRLAERRERLQKQLGNDLATACAEANIEMHVVSKEEPIKVRMTPFAVEIDRSKGQAKVLFARNTILECESTAEAIIKAHGQAHKLMVRDFKPAVFVAACFNAWRAARGVSSTRSSDRIEILDFLPYLALQFQSKSFRTEPSVKNYRGYSRARFAFDMDRLKKAKCLEHQGWRMNLGVATGGSTSKKHRVIYFEDEHGDGEFKLTVFFKRTEAVK